MEHTTTAQTSGDGFDMTGSGQKFEMFPRSWAKSEHNPILNHQQGYGPSFTVVTYNVLTELCMPKDEYLYCPEECRGMKDRHPRIMTELCTMDPDIVCLQEVDKNHWNRWLQEDMGRLGYKGVLFDPYNGQGLAVFYKDSVFQLLEEEHWYSHELAEAYIQAAPLTSYVKEEIRRNIKRSIGTILVKLQHVSGDVISVSNIHVSWEGLKYPALQALQVAPVVNRLVQFAGGPDKPHILCGDFNTPPDFPAYHMLTQSHLTPETKSLLNKMAEQLDESDTLLAKDLTEYLPSAFCLNTDLSSAYKSVLGQEPAVTNCDDCGLPERTNLCLDYFWFNQCSLEATGVLVTPSPRVLMSHYAMPSVLFPSDHLPLKAQFVFKS